MNRDQLKLQASKLHLATQQDVLEAIDKEGEELLSQINALKQIDIEGVKPMTRVDETPISFMREDIPGETFAKEKLLANAPETKDGFIVLKKVVSND